MCSAVQLQMWYQTVMGQGWNPGQDILFCFWLTSGFAFHVMPIKLFGLLTEAGFSAAESFQQLFSKPLDIPSWIILMPRNPENSSGQISKPFISGLPAGMYDLRSVDCLVYAPLLELQIITLRNNNKLNSETIQGWKEVVPVFLLKTAFGSQCFDGAGVHCFLAKLNKSKFVCIHSCAHAHFPSVPHSLRGSGGQEDVLLSAPNYLFSTVENNLEHSKPHVEPSGSFWWPLGLWWCSRSKSEAHYLRVPFALIPQKYQWDKTSVDNFWLWGSG